MVATIQKKAILLATIQNERIQQSEVDLALLRAPIHEIAIEQINIGGRGQTI